MADLSHLQALVAGSWHAVDAVPVPAPDSPDLASLAVPAATALLVVVLALQQCRKRTGRPSHRTRPADYVYVRREDLTRPPRQV